MIGLVGGLITALGALAQTWLQGKVEKSKAQTEAEITVIKKRAESEAQWEELMAKGSLSSWKDEWFTVLISIPFILTFTPWTREFAVDGFNALSEHVPDEYWYLLGIAYAAAFGVKHVIDFFRKK